MDVDGGRCHGLGSWILLALVDGFGLQGISPGGLALYCNPSERGYGAVLRGKDVKLLMAQIDPRVGEIEANKEKILEALAEGERQGCDLVICPELAVTGYPPDDLLYREAFLDASHEAVEQIVAATGRTGLIFGHPRRHAGTLRNSATLALGGRCIGVYDKRALPNYGVFDEKRYFTPGEGPEVFELAGWRIGIGICEDIWDDEVAEASKHLARDVLININASPFHAEKQAEREALMKRRAKQFRTPVVYVNPIGGQDEVVFDGGSHAVDADGDLLTRAPLFRKAYVVVDLASLAASNIAPIPSTIEEIHEALVLGVRDYVRRNGCNQVVIGLSGGIDSAVTAVIAVDALGKENVLGVLMPSRYTSRDSVEDAKQLGENLGIETLVIPIHAAVDAVEGMLSGPFAEWGRTTPDVTEENIQARIRGLLLMAISNKTGRMVLSTGNKSEMAVGYATLYGDMVGGFAVLKDVYKTQVYRLAHYINRKGNRIPQRCIEKPPSAELRPGQKDSDALPEYSILDAILKAYIEEQKGVDEIIDMGYEPETVRQVIRMVHQAEYKRRQAPPGIKITRLAFGRDRRYPITHGFKEWDIGLSGERDEED